MTNDGTTTDGDPESASHATYLLELGRTTLAAAQLATICFDLARILGGVTDSVMFDDPLGGLQRRLEGLDTKRFPELSDFLAALDSARRHRNDVLHAFLVRDGLFRRTARGGYDRAFYFVQDLRFATEQIEDASRLGSRVLYANGGELVRTWRQHVDP